MIRYINNLIEQIFSDTCGETHKSDRKLNISLYIPMNKKYCYIIEPLLRFKVVENITIIDTEKHKTIYEIDIRLSNFGKFERILDLLPSPSIVNNIPTDPSKDWKFVCESTSRIRYDNSPINGIKTIFENRYCENFMNQWLQILSANNPTVLSKSICSSKIDYVTDINLIEKMEKKNVVDTSILLKEERKEPIYIEINSISSSKKTIDGLFVIGTI